ncbi:MAG: PhnD/SsuA/transferrin family substrate-binding protein [Clostridium sp.]
MKKLIYIFIGTLILLMVIGLIDYRSKSIKLTENIGVLNGEITKLNSRITEAQSEVVALKRLVPKRTVGDYYVNSTTLNIRKQPQENADAIGVIYYGTKIKVTDTSNPLWYKATLDLKGCKRETKGENTVFKSNNNYIEVDSKRLNNINEFYVSSKYLSGTQVTNGSKAPIGEKPFTYGLTFYDSKIAVILAGEIWSNLKGELISLGYTGVRVTPINRNTYEMDVKNGIFDAIESAPGQFAILNKDKVYLRSFGKNSINGDTNYRGIVIANKNSNINSINDIKGKDVVAGKEFSEASYKYQKYYLKKNNGIDIEKDLKLEKGKYHQEVFYEVASGNASVGFCGDFVMTDNYMDIKKSLEKSGIYIESKEELDLLRDNLIVFNMLNQIPIPNNPHAVREDLSSNKLLVDKLYTSIKKVYSSNKEGYDVVEANNSEYEILNNIK